MGGRSGRVVGAVAVGLAALVFAAAATAPPPVPQALDWAYLAETPSAPPPALGDGPFVTPDGRRRLSPAQMRALTLEEEDWFSDRHPTPPAIVLGAVREGDRKPCAECHLVTGKGAVNVPDVAGLSEAYILEQVAAFRSGARASAAPDRAPTYSMTAVAHAWSGDEVKAAAAYYAGLPRPRIVHVVEADDAPRMLLERYGWTYPDPAGGREPLAGRIVEAPQSVPQVFMRGPDNRVDVYVPKGALARGARLVRTGGGGGQPCAACHGADLKGTAVAPPLAGREPGYLARMLWDIRSGARSGPSVALMQAPARGLSPAEMTDVAAYLASRDP